MHVEGWNSNRGDNRLDTWHDDVTKGKVMSCLDTNHIANHKNIIKTRQLDSIAITMGWDART